MNVRNCKKCGRIFNYVAGPPICPNCRAEQEELFQKTKSYIQDNKEASVYQVAEECEVDIQQLKQWIREERLEFADGSAIGVSCEKCGKSIKTGRFCEKCKAEMANGLNEVLESNKPKKEMPKPQNPKDNPKMRFLK